ncbi:uncharacterized protein PAC_15876 [Phialocephala subalpina]|uniref:Uncharacterized protein n=1 Tax=Phialocephala subalpina TaxID=576137 RepID=A0A1L7XM00_9HELO|nr:uncharacterized protein PAC_15876 [Phialocephala subalpina]
MLHPGTSSSMSSSSKYIPQSVLYIKLLRLCDSTLESYARKKKFQSIDIARHAASYWNALGRTDISD